jgi:dipeptide transport system permease protein
VENRGAVAGLVVVGFIVLRAAGRRAGALRPERAVPRRRACRPDVEPNGGSTRFMLGTDSLGRDMLSRLIHGARISLFIGLAVMGVSASSSACCMGWPACPSWAGKWWMAITRLMDLMMAVPSLVLAILVVAVLGPSLTNTIIAVTLVSLPRYVRLVRASALAELQQGLRHRRARGRRRPLRLMFATVLPNCLAPLIVQAALGVSDAILEAAALGFLGLGAQPPTAEWGTMLADAREFIRSNPWLVTLPGLAILVTVVSINLAWATGCAMRWTRR